MIYLFFVLFLMPLTTLGFTERIRERLILGSAMLADIKRECGKRKDEQNYEPLRTKLLAEPMPFYVRFVDKFFSPSKEARIATLWRETGALLNEFLYTLMPFTAFGSAAVWKDPDLQARLKALYAPDAVAAFNRSMEHLERLHYDLDAKLKSPHAWWPTQKYRIFKDADHELEVLIRHILEELLELRLLIQRLAPEFSASPFKYLVPKIEFVTAQLHKKHTLLEQLDLSVIERLYRDMRTDALHAVIMRCVPPIIPMG